MNHTTIYRVLTEEDAEAQRMKTIAYAAGEKKDIEKFYQDKKVYNIRLEEIPVATIRPQGAADHARPWQDEMTLDQMLIIAANERDHYYC